MKKRNSGSNRKLRRAKKVKNDEFYTKLSDIGNELHHYKKFFEGKVVYCNADDPYESNFFRYFALKFNDLHLKKLITTSYAGSPVIGTQLPLFNMAGIESPKEKQAIKIEINEVKDFNKDGAENMLDIEYILKNDRNSVTPLKGNGDFRSEECVALLDEADIVVTNPPFSLFREYIDLLIEHKKDFIILGNFNSVIYVNVFKNLISGKIRLGYIFHRNLDFMVPDNSETWDKTGDDGKKYKTIGIAWYTTLPVERWPEDLILTSEYSPEKYPKYVNYDAINIDRVVDIPKDYDGLMGVPITFLGYYDPSRFEILGIGRELQKKDPIDIGILEKLDKHGNGTGKYMKAPYSNLYIEYRPTKKQGRRPSFKSVKTGKLYIEPYMRLIIRMKTGGK